MFHRSFRKPSKKKWQTKFWQIPVSLLIFTPQFNLNGNHALDFNIWRWWTNEEDEDDYKLPNSKIDKEPFKIDLPNSNVNMSSLGFDSPF